MQTYAIVNQKGGSGKTTTAVNLGAALAGMGRKVLIVDLDVQRSATHWLGVPEAGQEILGLWISSPKHSDKKSTNQEEPVKTRLEDFAVPSSIPGLDVVPASQFYTGIERVLSQEVAAELILRKKIDALPKKYDIVLLDCPPALSIMTISALAAVQNVLVPVETHYMALEGLAQLAETIEVVRERLNPNLKLAGILPCRVVHRTKNAQLALDMLKKSFGGLVYETNIRENVRVAEAPSFNKPVMLYDKTSNGAEDYQAAAEEFIKRLGRAA